MNHHIALLKKHIQDLELQLSSGGIREALQSLERIHQETSAVYARLKSSDITLPNRSVDSSSRYVSNSGYKIIAQTKFIIKPLDNIDLLENSQIERFFRERTEELKNTGALDLHNRFWDEYYIISSTVYGAIPYKLLNEKQIEMLRKYSWRAVDVEVIAFKKGMTEEDILSICRQYFNKYFLIREKESHNPILFHFK